MEITFYTAENRPTPELFTLVTEFLHTHLGAFGDPLPEICKAVSHALGEQVIQGGCLATAEQQGELVAVAVLNRTGMAGFIPENILVYLAVRADCRGCGMGRRLLSEVIRCTEGDIALHVDQTNGAMKLYEQLGFKSKYVEMRLLRKEV